MYVTSRTLLPVNLPITLLFCFTVKCFAQVIDALVAKGLYHNSVIVFTTDNGGPAAGFDANMASNYPLRGVKATLWEGKLPNWSFLSSSSFKFHVLKRRNHSLFVVFKGPCESVVLYLKSLILNILRRRPRSGIHSQSPFSL